MVEGARLVAELVADIEHHRHFVGAVAMVLNEDVALQHACERFEPEVALGRLAAFAARAPFFIDIDTAAILGGIDPGPGEASDVAPRSAKRSAGDRGASPGSSRVAQKY